MRLKHNAVWMPVMMQCGCIIEHKRRTTEQQVLPLAVGNHIHEEGGNVLMMSQCFEPSSGNNLQVIVFDVDSGD